MRSPNWRATLFQRGRDCAILIGHRTEEGVSKMKPIKSLLVAALATAGLGLAIDSQAAGHTWSGAHGGGGHWSGGGHWRGGGHWSGCGQRGGWHWVGRPVFC